MFTYLPENEERFKDYKLVWEDNFEKDGEVDPEKWFCENGNRWANNESQAYTNRLSNVCVRNGQLVITALKEDYMEREYTSARINTRGKKEFKYGYFEIEAKLPEAVGTWPAFWFMPTDCPPVRWPLCGEIDMMEHTLVEKDVIVYSLHSDKHNHANPNTIQHSTKVSKPGSVDGYHKYGMEWTSDHIEYFYDGESVCKYSKALENQDELELCWPYDKPYYMIINVAVGGFMGGPIKDEELPSEMRVNYIRAYEK